MNNSSLEYCDTLYSILGVPKNASSQDIKKSYKILAIKYHPDKNINNPNAEENKKKFIKVQNAYEILYNESKRKMYDASLKQNDPKSIIKTKTKNAMNFMKNPAFYLIVLDKLSKSDFGFIGNFLQEGNIIKLLDIEITVEFTIYEYYNNIPKEIKHNRLTGGFFQEYIFAIDHIQIYEKEGESIEINDQKIYGNFIVNIKISSTEYKNINYYFNDNDLIALIYKNNIKNNKIKISYLNDNVYSFNIKKLKKVDDLIDGKLEMNKDEYSNIYYIENFGLPYFDENQDMNNIDLNIVNRGNLFFVLII